MANSRAPRIFLWEAGLKQKRRKLWAKSNGVWGGGSPAGFAALIGESMILSREPGLGGFTGFVPNYNE